MTAKDIPDSSKIKTMSSMFNSDEAFNDPGLVRWDTSNVVDMNAAFLNTKFNNDIGRWNISNVTSLQSMFLGDMKFNQYIGCWDVSKVTSINSMFNWATSFNQNLEKWGEKMVPGQVTSYDACFVSEKEGSSRGKGAISIKNYCILHNIVGGDLGRDKEKCIEEYEYSLMCEMVDGKPRWEDIVNQYISEHPDQNLYIDGVTCRLLAYDLP